MITQRQALLHLIEALTARKAFCKVIQTIRHYPDGEEKTQLFINAAIGARYEVDLERVEMAAKELNLSSEKLHEKIRNGEFYIIPVVVPGLSETKKEFNEIFATAQRKSFDRDDLQKVLRSVANLPA